MPKWWPLKSVMLDALLFLVSVITSQRTWSACEDLLSVSDFNQNRNVPTNTNSNIKFRANLSIGSVVVPRARTDGQADRQQTGMIWLRVVFAIVLRTRLKKRTSYVEIMTAWNKVYVSKRLDECLEVSALETSTKCCYEIQVASDIDTKQSLV
jgi:hypothetical protein